MEFIFFTDCHLRNTSPISRIDNYSESILKKIEYIIDYANSLNIKLLINGGDFFDTPTVPPSLMIKLVKILNKFNGEIYTVIGNHDIQGYNEITLSNSSLGVLIEAGLIKKLDIIEKDNVLIKGYHCYSNIESNFYLNGKINIAIMHKPITNMNIPKKIKIENCFNNTKYDIILSGDIHMPHFIKKDNRIAINPGAIARTSISEKHRTPMFVKMSLNPIKIELIKIPFEKNVFVEEKENKIDNNNFIEEYYLKIIKAKKEKITIEEQINEFLKVKDCPIEIKEIIKKYFIEAKNKEGMWI